MKDRNMKDECFDCKHKRFIPGTCHIKCVKPDLNMSGNLYGKQYGWFNYPSNFDPVWKTKICDNFEEK